MRPTLASGRGPYLWETFILGGVPNTISDTAFAVYGGHDVTLQGNTVTDPNYLQNGQIARLVTYNTGGYNFSIVGNTVGQDVGIFASNPVNAPGNDPSRRLQDHV